MVSGSAPCSPEVLGFFEAIGMPIHESYGVSENMLPIAVNPPDNYRLGSVGRPLPDQEVRLASDGEVLVRGSTLHQIEIPDRTPLTSEGFYATGDLGRFDEDGYLYLVGRRSEIIKTSNGRKIALPQLEAHFRDAPGIDQVVIFGHGRPHLVALVSLAPGVPHAPDFLSALIAQRNAFLPRHERLSAVHVLSKDLSPLTGELTPNLKLRRAEIEKRHRASIEILYTDLAREPREEKILVRWNEVEK